MWCRPAPPSWFLRQVTGSPISVRLFQEPGPRWGICGNTFRNISQPFPALFFYRFNHPLWRQGWWNPCEPLWKTQERCGLTAEIAHFQIKYCLDFNPSQHLQVAKQIATSAAETHVRVCSFFPVFWQTWLSMDTYVHIYIYIYTYIYIHIYIWIHTYMDTSIYIYTYIYICIYIYRYTHICICIYIYIYIWIHTYMDTSIYIYIHILHIYHILLYLYIYIYICTHICINIHIYIYTYV